MKLITQGEVVVFTVEIDSKIEKDLVQKYDMAIDILKVAHHGSKFSSSDEFLKVATPKVALIEVGEKNTYGHPTPQALQRLLAVGAQILRTDLDGTIKLLVSSSTINVFKR